jgi:TatD DNase family protein
VQQRVLRAHIGAARMLDLPLIIHTREADALMAEILEEEHARHPFRLLMHCYTSGKELAQRAAALGAYFSFSGILTFKNATDVRQIALDLPLERIILETDCPYLAPIPHRGRRCEPAYVADIYRYFAQLRGLDEQTCAARVADNFHAIFQKVPA